MEVDPNSAPLEIQKCPSTDCGCLWLLALHFTSDLPASAFLFHRVDGRHWPAQKFQGISEAVLDSRGFKKL